METLAPLTTALGIVFGVSGVGIAIATGWSWRRLSASVLTRRYLCWLALTLVYCAALALGAPGATLLAMLFAAQCAREAAPLLRLAQPYRAALIAQCAVLPVFLALGWIGWSVGVVLLVALAFPLLRGRADELDAAGRLVLGTLLLGWTLGHLPLLASVAPGWLVLALFGTAVSDVCAFTLGSLLRGPKLAPAVSPGKTWAGLAGNIAGAALALVLVAPLLPPIGLHVAGALVLVIGLGGCAGDLSESLLKRWAGVKDAGSWLPGFGGLLDRVDSLLVVAPLLMLVVTLFV